MKSSLALLSVLSLFSLPGLAEEPNFAPSSKEPSKTKTPEILAKELRPSVVVITAKGRETRRDALGTGFIVDANGIIATNMHVIGEGRAIQVEFADGKKRDAVAVLGTDRAHDLALIKVDAKDLPAIPLGDSTAIKDGQGVVTLGNPQGLKYSIVTGVVSGVRDIDGQSMIQLAIPLEPGNSGGPVVDMSGKVIGIATMKSLVTANLGFAVPVNTLKPLIAKPNPVRMEDWIKIGALDPEEWRPVLGATWRQRAGRLTVQGAGSGFGGRALCIAQQAVPVLPYELTVTVKLDDERGAAGLLFHYEDEKHYGFYPTGGKLRLTRFDGADVFSWKILEEKGTPAYLPGEWNTLKVRVAKDGIKCYVNDQLVIESSDTEWTTGKAGLCKFRDTNAEFKQFRIARNIPSRYPSAEEIRKVLKQVEGVSAKQLFTPSLVENLSRGKATPDILRDRARELERQATKLKELAACVHQQRILDELGKVLAGDEKAIDLIHAVLLVAKLDNEDIDVDAYREEVDRLGRKLKETLPNDADDALKLAKLNQFFFEQRGFHGSRSDYYSRSNSYLNEVLDDREGLPITLSIVYMELARRIGLPLAGIGMPGHFVVRHLPSKGDGVFIDVFERGKTFTAAEAKERIENNGYTFREEFLQPVTKKQIVGRMFQNLLRVAREENDTDSGLRYLDAIILLEPDGIQERFMRSVLRYSKGMKKEALEDIEYLLEHTDESYQERPRLLQLKRMLDKELRAQEN